MLQTEPAFRTRHTSAARTAAPPPRDAGAGQQLPRLTSLRTFGAFAVFLFHAGRWGVKDLPHGIATIGYAGVTFFFILSGFVLAWGTKPGLPARTFWWRRFARVWPSHVTMLVVASLVPLIQVARTWKIAAVNLPLLQAWFYNNDRVTFGMDATSWSLSAEAFFYLCFPLLVLCLGRLPRLATWGVAAAAMGLEVWAVMGHPYIAYQVPLLRLPEFLLGLVAGLAFRSGWRPRIPASVAFLLVLAGGWYSIGLALPWADVVLAVPFLCALLAAARRDVAEKPGILRSRILVFAGEVSFAFYLVHELVIVNLREHLTLHHTVNLAIIFVVASAGSVALHLLVEKPVNKLLRRVPIGRPRRRTDIAPPARRPAAEPSDGAFRDGPRAAHTEPIHLPELAAHRTPPAPRSSGPLPAPRPQAGRPSRVPR